MKKVINFLSFYCLVIIWVALMYSGVTMVIRNSFYLIDLKPWIFGLMLVYILILFLINTTSIKKIK